LEALRLTALEDLSQQDEAKEGGIQSVARTG